MHFPRERTPLWKHITALQPPPPPPGFDPLNVKQIVAEAERQLIRPGGDGRRAGLYVEVSVSERMEGGAEVLT